MGLGGCVSERVFVVALLGGFGIVAFQQYQAKRFPPPPSVFVGVALIFTVLAVVAVAAPGIAAGFGVAADLGLMLRPIAGGAQGGAPTSGAPAIASAGAAGTGSGTLRPGQPF